MAIDTAAKRKSLAGVIGYIIGGPGVTNNATHNLAWRQQAGYGYSGIPASGAVAVPATWLLLLGVGQ